MSGLARPAKALAGAEQLRIKGVQGGSTSPSRQSWTGRRRWPRGLLRTRLPRVTTRRYPLLAGIDASRVVAALVAATYLRFELAMTHQQLRSLLPAPGLRGHHLLLCAPRPASTPGDGAPAASKRPAHWRARWRSPPPRSPCSTPRCSASRIPVGACIAAGPIGLVAMGAARYAVRLRQEQDAFGQPSGHRRGSIVFGAGEGGDQTITAMMRNPDSPYVPGRAARRRPGQAEPDASRACAVAGGREQLGAVAASTGATAVVIAIPSAERRR